MIGFFNFIKLKFFIIMFLVMGSLIGVLFFKVVVKDFGYLLLVYGCYIFEISLLVGVLCIFLLCYVVYWIWLLLWWLFDVKCS